MDAADAGLGCVLMGTAFAAVLTRIRGGVRQLAPGAALDTDIGTSARRPEGKSAPASAQPALLPVVSATPASAEALAEAVGHDHDPAVGLELLRETSISSDWSA